MSDRWLELYNKIKGENLKTTGIPAVIFILLILLTYVIWTMTSNQIFYERNEEFKSEVNRVLYELNNRINTGSSILYGIKGYYESMSHSISPKEWADYIGSLQPFAKQTCIDGLGYIKKMNKDEIGNQIKIINDYVSQTLKNPSDIVLHPVENKDVYYLVKFFSPLTQNNSAIEGFDYSSQPQLAKVLQDASASGLDKGTPIQTMWGMDNARVDTIIPVYWRADSATAQKGDLRGFAFAVSDINACGVSILNTPKSKNIVYQVTDVTDNPSAPPFFRSGSENKFTPQFFVQQEVNFHGRQWLLRFEALPQFGANISSMIFLIAYPIVGIILSFVISLSILLYATSRKRALLLVDKVTGELQESEAKLKAIFEQAPDAVFILDNGGKVVDVNGSGLALLGVSREDLIGKRTIFDRIPSEYEEKTKTAWEKLLSEGKLRTDLAFIGAISGQTRQIEVTAKANFVPGLHLAIIRDVTHHRGVESALKQSNETMSAMLNATVDAVYLIKPDGTFIAVNKPGAVSLNKKSEELVGTIMYDYYPGELALSRRNKVEKVIKTGKMIRFEDSRAGRYLFNSIYPIQDEKDNVTSLVIFVEDITDRKLAEMVAKRASRALRVLSESNQFMIRAENENDFLEKVCNVVVSSGGYRLAWIGEAMNDLQKTVKPVAQAGYESGYLNSIRISWADNEYGRGPTGIAIRTKTASVMRDILNDPSYSIWREAALKRGYASSIALPIPLNSTIFGALNIYTSEPDTFDENEINLLTELANDIGFGIISLRTKKSLRESEEKYKSIVNISPDAIAIHSGERVLFVNNSALRMLGANSLEEVVGKPIINFIHPESLALAKERIVRIMSGKEKYLPAVDEKFIRFDGSAIEASVVSALVVFEGRPAVQIILRDISERKQYEENLKQVNADLEKFKLAVQNASDHIMITDPDAKILFANAAASKITGYSADEMIGKTPRLWGGQMPSDFYKEMWKTIKDNKKPFIREITNKRKSGELYQAITSISPIFDNRGDILFFVGIERDVTKERLVDKSKSEFVSLASHQLRTPLSAINWYTEMLIDEDVGKLNKKQKNYLGEIYHSSKRMADLVGSLLNVSRIELGTFAIEPRLTDITEISKSVIKELLHEVKKRHQKLIERYDKKVELINVDQSLMRIVLQNLISNAVKYTPNKGTIRVEIGKAEDKIIISVADTGYGIPEKFQPKVFGKFFRADNIREIETDGTGLGLYIVKEIVEKSGGSIWFESKENKGTKFYVSLPVAGMTKKEGSKKLV